jgi:phenylalanyl-tRNA synthetase beta chain
MNIKIIDSWLREYLVTKATAETIAEKLSLCSVSVEKIEKIDNDLVYEIEVTSNRPDLMSVYGIAREAAAVLPQFGIDAKLLPLDPKQNIKSTRELPLEIINDPKLVNRICTVLMDIKVGDSPKYIKERIEKSGIRSLNNLIDVTNYVMREVGHPCHVFDFDRLKTKKLIIRESKKEEKIITLDDKLHVLLGGDIVADSDNGQIVDLLGVMGTANSVVTDQTKRILFFIDNGEPNHIRKTSMNNNIRTEAAVINEKNVDPELAKTALLRGIELYTEIAEGEVISEIVDIYPNQAKTKAISVFKDKIDTVVGSIIPIKTCGEILEKLGFKTKIKESSIAVEVPSWRIADIEIEEDVIEEIARIYGYHRLPSVLPPLTSVENYHIEKDEFYWENRTKNLFKCWGFTEVFTYSMISEELLEGPIENAVALKNPLNEDLAYLRKTLIPSLLGVIKENKNKEQLKIFEIANIYEKRVGDLPRERRMIAGVIKKPDVSFFEAKGIVEALLNDCNIKNIIFKNSEFGGIASSIFVGKDYLGEVELLDVNIVNFELNFEKIVRSSNLNKIYKPLAKYPPVIEDLAIIATSEISTADIIEEIFIQSDDIQEVTLLDQFQNTRTFHVIYQSEEGNLSSEDVKKLRDKILNALDSKFQAKLKK